MLTENDLQQFGLSKSAALIYMNLLQNGGLSASELAENTGISRTNIYNLIEQLAAQDLVTVDFKGSKKRFSANDPEVFLKKTEGQLQMISRLLPELKALYHLHPAKPKISYHEGSEGVRAVTDDLLTAKDGRYCYFGSVLAQFELEGPDHLNEFIARRLSSGIKSFAIRPRRVEKPGPLLEANVEMLRQVRHFPRPVPDSIPNLYIYDSRIAIISSAGEKWALIIESPELSSLLQSVWDMIWDISLEKDS